MLKATLEQFQILSLFSNKFLAFDLSITNFLLINLLIGFLVISYTFCSQLKTANPFKKTSIFFAPNSWQRVLESTSEIVSRLITDIIPTENNKYVPIISVIFNYILVGNLIGLIPYSFTITSHVIVTFTLSFSVFIGITLIAFEKYKTKTFALFIPANSSFILAIILVPIEFISYIARPFSLGMRLFINLMAGHSLLKVVIAFSWAIIVAEEFFSFCFVPILIGILLFGLELGVALIQTYVFVILTCIYLQDVSTT